MKLACVGLFLALAGCASMPGMGTGPENPRRGPGHGSTAAPAPEGTTQMPATEAPAVAAAPTAEELQRLQAEKEYNRGTGLEQRGKTQEAFEAYQACLKLDPHYARAHVGIGNCYLMTNHFNDAEKAYLNGLKSDPKCATAHNNLAWLYVTTKTQLERAADESRKAIDLTQAQLDAARAQGVEADVERQRMELAECYSTQGWVYFHQSEHMAAVIAWDSAAKQLPEKETARRAVFLYRMALSLSLQGEPARALTAIEQARSLKPTPDLAAKLDALEASLATK